MDPEDIAVYEAYVVILAQNQQHFNEKDCVCTSSNSDFYDDCIVPINIFALPPFFFEKFSSCFLLYGHMCTLLMKDIW